MEKIKDMFHYGSFERRIIFMTTESVISAIIWQIINQYLLYFSFDNGIASENIQFITLYAIFLLVKVILNTIEGIYHCIIRHHLQRDFSYYARKDIFENLINAKVSYFDSSDTGELLELSMNDSQKFATFFTQNGQVTLRHIFTIIVCIVTLLFMNVKLAGILVVIYIIGYLGIFISNKKRIKLIKKIREADIAITKSITEQINGLEIIKNLRIEEERIKTLSNMIDKYNKESRNLDKVIRNYKIVYDLLSLLALMIVGIFGGLNLSEGIMTYGALMVFINSTSRITKSVNHAINHTERLFRDYISFLKILKFKEDVKLEKDEGKEGLKRVENIELKNIEFSYNENSKVLKGINLFVNKNEKIAIIGKTGSGKTTLVNLLCRFYELESGEILINGKDYKDYSLSTFRDKIGYVMQDVIIFKGNVYDNINYANKNISNEEIIKICRKLKLHDKIMSLKDGYETNLSENKDILSQGEKQMINFARIMVENPEIIILDEITSSLSYENEELVKNAVKEVMEGRICFVIAHRLSTIKNCDKILLMEDGKIVEQGSHEELIDRKEKYYNLVNA